jgi:hypothetical protein
MATIKKAQNSGTVKDTTKTYETSPFQKAKEDKSKKSIEYKAWLRGASVDPISAERFKKEADKKKNGGSVKMKNGGSLSGLKASNKRVGPVDPKGAYTKVQKKTLAGAKGKASLTKDKQLGATKMAKCGTKMSKK